MLSILAKRFIAFWPAADVLPAEKAHGTKWGNLQDFCADEKEFLLLPHGSTKGKGTHITRICGIGHDFEPALKGGDLKEGQVEEESEGKDRQRHTDIQTHTQKREKENKKSTRKKEREMRVKKGAREKKESDRQEDKNK